MKLNRNTIVSYSIYIAIIAGLFIPAPAFFKKLIPVLLCTILFFNFLKLKLELHRYFRKELLYHPVLGILVIPTILYFATPFLSLDLRIGLFLTAITPSAMSSPIVSEMIGGDRELAITNSVLSNLIAPLTFSVLLFLFFHTRNLSIPVGKLFQEMVVMIMIPLVLSLLVRMKRNVKDAIIGWSHYINPAAFVFVLFVSISTASVQLKAIDMNLILITSLITGALAALNFFVGYQLSKDEPTRRSLSILFGHRNSVLTLWVALSNFNPLAAVPMVTYVIFHHIINGLMIHYFARKDS